MSDAFPGQTGAAKTTYSADNPRALIAELCDGKGRDDTDALIERAAEGLLAEKYRATLATYYATNAVRAYFDGLERPMRSHTRTPDARMHAAQMKAEFVEKIVEKAKLLGMLAPNGKPLSLCTFAECKAFGGWYMRLARGKDAKAQVGAHYNEKQLREAQTWID